MVVSAKPTPPRSRGQGSIMMSGAARRLVASRRGQGDPAGGAAGGHQM
jgi:hypothetical protein